jgi:hypothetical protein
MLTLIEGATIPDEPQLLHGKPQTFCNPCRRIGAAVLQENTKLVASQSRQQTAGL